MTDTAEFLSHYERHKRLADGRLAVVSGGYFDGKARILVNVDYAGYQHAY